MSEEFRLDEHRGDLKTEHKRSKQTGPLKDRRAANISWVRRRSRSELEHGAREKQLQFVQTEQGERLFIQYPGKESEREGEDKRPWDFRPRVLFADGSYGPDLSFYDVWDTLFEEFEELGDDGIAAARGLAAIFYRMAFMVDHTPDYEFEAETRLVDGSEDPLTTLRTESFDTVYRYTPPEQVIRNLSKVLPELGGMSLEAFLHYNDLMAWNEDCKYYYRDTDGGETDWDWPRTGRIKNLLTHISILGIITGDLRLSRVLNKFQSGRGVAPVTKAEAEAITGGIIGGT